MGAPASIDDCYHLRDPNPAPCEGCAFRPTCREQCRLFTAYVCSVRDQKAKADYLEGLATGKGRGEWLETGLQRAINACRDIRGEFGTKDACGAFQSRYGKPISDTAMNNYMRQMLRDGMLVRKSFSVYEVTA